jgi:hypothetical protein
MKTLTLDDIGEFTWSFSKQFLIETCNGNFVWNDPDYGGDNIITLFDGDYKKWCDDLNIPYGRDKGTHTIRGYCGEKVKIIS